jgi:outer membrane protein assembly factor BamB
MLACFVLGSAGSVRAQDWPQWRGPNRDAKATGFNAPSTWPKQLTQKWKVTVGGGDSSPALVGDKLYVFTRQGEDEVIRCLDAASGNQIWQQKYQAQAPPERPAGGPHAGPRSSPTVADGKVVTLGVRATLSCFDAAAGNPLWRKDDFKGATPRFFASSSPLVVDGRCIAQLGSDSDGAIVAYDLSNGNEKWKWTGDGAAYASPVLLAVGNSKLIVAETAGNIVGLSLAEGKPLWKIPFKVRYNACTPVVDGQTVIYSGSGAKTHAVKIENKGDEFAANEVWSNPDNAVQFNTPVVKDGLVFGLSDRDNLFCLNEENGKTAWSVPKGPAARGGQPPEGGKAEKGAQKGKGGRGGRGGMGGGAGYGSIVDAGSVLLALTPSMDLIVFQPSEKEFKQIARYKVATTPTYAYPVVSGNRIFVKDQDSVTLWTIE